MPGPGWGAAYSAAETRDVNRTSQNFNFTKHRDTEKAPTTAIFLLALSQLMIYYDTMLNRCLNTMIREASPKSLSFAKPTTLVINWRQVSLFHLYWPCLNSHLAYCAYCAFYKEMALVEAFSGTVKYHKVPLTAIVHTVQQRPARHGAVSCEPPPVSWFLDWLHHGSVKWWLMIAADYLGDCKPTQKNRRFRLHRRFRLNVLKSLRLVLGWAALDMAMVSGQ